jgi:hypothetical protein
MTIELSPEILAEQQIAKEALIDIFMKRILDKNILPENIKSQYQSIFNLIGSGKISSGTLLTILQLMHTNESPHLRAVAVLIKQDISNLIKN